MDKGAIDHGSTSHPSTPTITLPKGGASLQGSGEKFNTNIATGAGSVVVPILTSSGRGGFGPSLSLHYNSGSGNGPFGLGWSLSLPAITRRTSRGIPQYCDAVKSDVFLLSSHDELVPYLDDSGHQHVDGTTIAGYTIERYRPRLENAFTRIERCTNQQDPADVHWRTYSSDNVLSLYGSSYESRVTNPTDKRQIFSWLLAETRDYKGNAILYTYARDDAAGIDLSKPHERNRGRSNDARRATSLYLKSARYGNTKPFLDVHGNRPHLMSPAMWTGNKWLFELVLDYGEHGFLNPLAVKDGTWDCREDAFSSYRAGFEIRVTRRCKRFLMFHHFEHEVAIGDNCLVSSTTLEYSSFDTPYSFLQRVIRTGFKRNPLDLTRYITIDQPPVNFEYSLLEPQKIVREVNRNMIHDLPAGIATPSTRWIDLYGDGLPGFLSESHGAWFYKRNFTPINSLKDIAIKIPDAIFGPSESVSSNPNIDLFAQSQIIDFKGDGRLHHIVNIGRNLGSFVVDGKDGWDSFTPYIGTLNRDTRDISVRYVDLDGDGLLDTIVEEDKVSIWYPSVGMDGFQGPLVVPSVIDEENTPRHLFSNTDETIYFSDMSGDGLSDVVRIRNGEACYWPNLGYGRFGAKVEMGNAPVFDCDEVFANHRIILADIDGSGPADLIYLHRSGVRIYQNRCGNDWSPAQEILGLPLPTSSTKVAAIDLLGNGTQCLVLSTPRPGSTPDVYYLNLLGSIKPFLLTGVDNNMGARTQISYAPSTQFFLEDCRDGRPWISRVPFPVHVVETVTTWDAISNNRFQTRYSYHHGFYDLEEREFCGFGMVEQWDSEDVGSSSQPTTGTDISNLSTDHKLPPVRTKTWFHTGYYPSGKSVSLFYKSEYYSDAEMQNYARSGQLLPDSCLPIGLDVQDQREAIRALKGSILRQEIYSDDIDSQSSLASRARAQRPHVIVETNFLVKMVQSRATNRYSVFQALRSEAVSVHTERDASDPRISHSLTLETNDYGQVMKELSIAYGRLAREMELPTDWDRNVQTVTRMTYVEHAKTNAVDDRSKWPFSYQLPTSWESRSFELTGFSVTATNGMSQLKAWTANEFAALTAAEELGFEEVPQDTNPQKRLLSCNRSVFRKDDLSGFLPVGQLEGLAIGGETYTLALTDKLLANCMHDGSNELLDGIVEALTTIGPSDAGYRSGKQLKTEGLFLETDPDDYYWIPSGRSFYAKESGNERELAKNHFFLPIRHCNPYGAQALVAYDDYDLLPVETSDYIGCRLSVGDRRSDGSIARKGIDYRLVQPSIVTDANGNRTEVAYDALGRVSCSAVMGKFEERVGDVIQDLDASTIDEHAIIKHLDAPLERAVEILGTVTTRHMYDEHAYVRTKDSSAPQPCRSYTMTRVTHKSELQVNENTEILHRYTFADGFGRAVQSKSLVDDGPIPQRDERGNIIIDRNQQALMTTSIVSPRWVMSEWIIHNNKGQPVRRFEPSFTGSHQFESDVRIGASAVVFYDALGRTLATLMPDGTYTKVLTSPWKTVTWDENDTSLDDPRIDPDIEFYVKAYIDRLPGGWKTWYNARSDRSMGTEAYDAARKAETHAGTPVIGHLDSLGRTFLAVNHSKVVCEGHPLDKSSDTLYARSELDISGRPVVLRDSLTTDSERGRIVSRMTLDMLGRPLFKESLEIGNSWSLWSARGDVIFGWNQDGSRMRSEYDAAGRLVRTLHREAPSDTTEISEITLTRNIYGDNHWEAAKRNLRGKVYAVADQAGFATTEQLDFKGNAVTTTARINLDYKSPVDWSTLENVLPSLPHQPIEETQFHHVLDNFLSPEVFESTSQFDALGRMLSLVTPHHSSMRPNIVRLQYTIQKLDSIEVNLLSEKSADGAIKWTSIVNSMDYNSKGQKLSTIYGNLVTSTDEYNFVNQISARYLRRNVSNLEGDMMALHLTYDAAGNVTNVRDDAKQTLYYDGDIALPQNSFVYDSVYRLIAASGREHVGQAGSVPTPYSYSDKRRFDSHPGQAAAMATYTEQYTYDAASNIRKMKHIGLNGTWVRDFSYETMGSITGESDHTNKLTFTETSGGTREEFRYDAMGNMIRIPHLGGRGSEQNVKWDAFGRLRELDLGGGGKAFYTYDKGGNRIRKVVERSDTLREERIYLGEMEIFRQIRSGNTVFERETLNLHDEKGRIALIETRTRDDQSNDRGPRQLIRYQYTGNLGSSRIELDQDARLLTYEEYSPYGSTTYQATTPNLETPKRFRFTGKERDEESGLGYHGARYLAPWLGRWVSPDPGGTMIDGQNLYLYAGANPVRYSDSSGLNGEEEIKGPYFGPTPSEKSAMKEFPAAEISIQENDAPGAKVPDPGGKGNTKTGFAPEPPSLPPEALASSPSNKVFMLASENHVLANSTQVRSSARMSFAPVSLETHPELLFSRNFGELVEMEMITKAAVELAGPRGSRTVAQYNRAINRGIWTTIKIGLEGNEAVTKAAAIVRRAFWLNKAPVLKGGPPRLLGPGSKLPPHPDSLLDPPGAGGKKWGGGGGGGGGGGSSGSGGGTAGDSSSSAPSPEAVAETPATKSMVETLPPVEGTSLKMRTAKVGSVVGTGFTIFQGAGAVGEAVDNFRHGEIMAGVKSLGLFGLVTKYPRLGKYLLPLAFLSTAENHPELRYAADRQYFEMVHRGRSEGTALVVWTVMAAGNTFYYMMIEQPAEGIEKGLGVHRGMSQGWGMLQGTGPFK